MKDITQLTEGWHLRHGDALLDARVPGCVHSDLLAAGAIPDPFIGLNEKEVAWVGRREWTYTTHLAHDSAHERTHLVFDGLDTAARVTLAGEPVGATRNMHRRYRFDVTGRTGELEVRFASAYDEAAAVRAVTGERPNVYPEPSQYVRKMACSFGWDWGPTVVTAGIWRGVRLEHWSTARVAEVRPLVTVEGTTGRVEVRIDVERTARGEGRPLRVRARVGGGGGGAGVAAKAVAAKAVAAEAASGGGGAFAEAVVTGDEAVLRLEVPDVRLWWPRGYGDQPLYDLEVTLADDDGPLDAWHRRIGFRTVELDRSADAHGTGFTLVVNGVRVFARGVNWIPDDVLPSRVTPERYRTRLAQAADANVDLVRVWGGGIYEDEAFYDACDELGLMVWQDFLFACSAYPEEQPLRGEVEAEARDNVVRLMPHPSLVLWNGNNENLWGFRDWGWEPDLAGDSWGEGYYLGLLPRVVAELDPTRPYAAGSPWSGSWDHHPNDPAHGTHHSWEVWNRRDYAEYRASVPRFVAEFGWQAPPALATLRRALPGERLAPDSPGMLHHQKAEDGNGKLNRGVARHFPLPDGDFDRWHYLTQLVQARAVAAGIEHWRAHWPVCAGTVVWQLNDCWPVSSWSAIDGDGRPKPLHHELRRVYADRLLTLLPGGARADAGTGTGEGAGTGAGPDTGAGPGGDDTDAGCGGEGPTLAVINQSADPWHAAVTLRRLAADGTVLHRTTLDVAVEPRSVVRVPVPEAAAPAEGTVKEFLVADADGLRAVHFPVPDKDFAYVPPRFDVAVEPVPGRGDRVDVVVSAHTPVRDLLLQADRLGAAAAADRGPQTLLPGEVTRIRLTGCGTPDAADVRAALFCVDVV
ncbi:MULTISPECIES: glycoside hydrolase family 2 protein [Streptomyces]|uniref:beta-mannosidase n=2 Tax=Streptomyces TaxID=1883 RepID=A0A100Y3S2_9ACTN|nr:MULTISPECIES: glycoside hydrolase family 2 protein [Streptomyces]KUH37127.1 beta-mannosidase [Streptomyces kanasensis]UUS33399.1 glycoside hydrolase family 2 protein [Streptomyces changanensis]